MSKTAASSPTCGPTTTRGSAVTYLVKRRWRSWAGSLPTGSGGMAHVVYRRGPSPEPSESPPPSSASKGTRGEHHDNVDSDGAGGVAVRRPARLAHVAGSSRGAGVVAPGRPPGRGESRARRRVAGRGAGEAGRAERHGHGRGLRAVRLGERARGRVARDAVAHSRRLRARVQAESGCRPRRAQARRLIGAPSRGVSKAGSRRG